MTPSSADVCCGKASGQGLICCLSYTVRIRHSHLIHPVSLLVGSHKLPEGMAASRVFRRGWFASSETEDKEQNAAVQHLDIQHPTVSSRLICALPASASMLATENQLLRVSNSSGGSQGKQEDARAPWGVQSPEVSFTPREYSTTCGNLFDGPELLQSRYTQKL